MILVTGASASGKSAFAEQLVMKSGRERRVYLATMIPWDEECRKRIERHKRLRAEKRFETIECPVDIEGAMLPKRCVVLLECMSNLTANELFRGDLVHNDVQAAEERIRRGIARLMETAGELVVVTNEVFEDGEKYPEETERYRRLLGRLNIWLAERAGTVYEVLCGIAVKVKQPGIT
ncbi:MAG: bifunctional adenosylcobinamide kinase/adenosylcobinamide-phosphate guanylyltransferase [Lachnospiraceae bacterium]|nr:bifunctional adenosylcobinamide kinase/adenosylcobinamide-phosphate guanylyltransferase [Lachnospiraceae bacterium]